jgi:hypothetical protein
MIMGGEDKDTTLYTQGLRHREVGLHKDTFGR